jgi:hypothetical protein
VGSWDGPIGRCAVAGVGRGRGSGRTAFRASATATCRRGSASGSGIRSGGARTHMGSAPTSGAGIANSSRRPHLGRRTHRAPGGAERPVVGAVGCRRAASSDLGVAGARTIPFRAAARAVMGRQQNGHPRGVDAGTVMGLARKRLQAAWFRLGRPGSGFVGCPRRCGARRSAGRGPVVGRAPRRARVGHPQDSGARRAGCAVVVGPVGRSAPTSCAAASNSNGTDAAAAGLRADMVGAGGVSSPAEVP